VSFRFRLPCCEEKSEQLDKILVLVKRIDRELFPSPVKISFALPTITRNGVLVPNFELKNDTVATIPIVTEDAAGNVVPATAGDTFTAVSSLPASLGVAVTNNALVLTPLVQASPGLTVTVSDADGLTAATLTVDIVPDLSPTQVVLETADATTVPQAPPTAPGP
jgi:hypothetical protein